MKGEPNLLFTTCTKNILACERLVFILIVAKASETFEERLEIICKICVDAQSGSIVVAGEDDKLTYKMRFW